MARVGAGHEAVLAGVAAWASRTGRVLAADERAADLLRRQDHGGNVARLADRADGILDRVAAAVAGVRAPAVADVVAQVEAGLDALEERDRVGDRVAQVDLGRAFLGLGVPRFPRRADRLRQQRLLGGRVGRDRDQLVRADRDGLRRLARIQGRVLRRVGRVERTAGGEAVAPQAVRQHRHGHGTVVVVVGHAVLHAREIGFRIADEEVQLDRAVLVAAAQLQVLRGRLRAVVRVVGQCGGVADRVLREMVVRVGDDRSGNDVDHRALEQGVGGRRRGVVAVVARARDRRARARLQVVDVGRAVVRGALHGRRIGLHAAHAERELVHVVVAAVVAALGIHGEVVVDLEVEAQVEVLALVELALDHVAHVRGRVVVPLVQAGDQLGVALLRGRAAGVRDDRAGLGRRQQRERRVAVGLGPRGRRSRQHVERRGRVEGAAGRQRRLEHRRARVGVGRHRARLVRERLVGRVVEVGEAVIARAGRVRHLDRVRFVGQHRVRRVDDDAQAAIEEFVGQDQVRVRLPDLVEGALRTGHAQRCKGLLEVQARARLDLDAAAQRAFGHVGGGTLDDVDALDQVGRELAEFGAPAGAAAVHVGAAGRLHALPVDLDAGEVGAVAAHGHADAFAEIAAVERDAGHARNRFAHVAVGEGADVLGDDRIDRGGRVLLAVDARLLRGARGDDLHLRDLAFIGLGGILRILRERHVARDERRDGKRHRDAHSIRLDTAGLHLFHMLSMLFDLVHS